MPTFKGPMFDGTAARAVDDFVEAASAAIAEQGKIDVQQQLKSVLRHPTGKYSSSIHVVKQSVHSQVLDGKIYGSWLEGTSSRNGRTRFKGYRTFERVAKALDGKASKIAEGILPTYTRRMT